MSQLREEEPDSQYQSTSDNDHTNSNNNNDEHYDSDSADTFSTQEGTDNTDNTTEDKVDYMSQLQTTVQIVTMQLETLKIEATKRELQLQTSAMTIQSLEQTFQQCQVEHEQRIAGLEDSLALKSEELRQLVLENHNLLSQVGNVFCNIVYKTDLSMLYSYNYVYYRNILFYVVL